MHVPCGQLIGFAIIAMGATPESVLSGLIESILFIFSLAFFAWDKISGFEGISWKPNCLPIRSLYLLSSFLFVILSSRTAFTISLEYCLIFWFICSMLGLKRFLLADCVLNLVCYEFPG